MPLGRLRFLTTLAAFAPALLAAQEPRSAAVAGRVLVRGDSTAPAPAGRASVAILGTSVATVTSADGRFLLAPVPPGPRTLRVRLPGYGTVDRAIRPRDGDTLRVEVANGLVPENADELPEPGNAGVGLANVRHRLEAVFGKRATLTAEETGGRFVATIRIPGVKRAN